MKKKILSLVLALLVCCSAAFFFAGCQSDPAHQATLTTDTKSLEFKVGDTVAALNAINALEFTYTPNGDTYGIWDATEGKFVNVEYKPFTKKKYSEAVKAAASSTADKQSEVRTCNYSGLDITSETTGTQTRTLVFTINNAVCRIPYTVKAQQQSSNT